MIRSTRTHGSTLGRHRGRRRKRRLLRSAVRPASGRPSPRTGKGATAVGRWQLLLHRRRHAHQPRRTRRPREPPGTDRAGPLPAHRPRPVHRRRLPRRHGQGDARAYRCRPRTDPGRRVPRDDSAVPDQAALDRAARLRIMRADQPEAARREVFALPPAHPLTVFAAPVVLLGPCPRISGAGTGRSDTADPPHFPANRPIPNTIPPREPTGQPILENRATESHRLDR